MDLSKIVNWKKQVYRYVPIPAISCIVVEWRIVYLQSGSLTNLIVMQVILRKTKPIFISAKKIVSSFGKTVILLNLLSKNVYKI